MRVLLSLVLGAIASVGAVILLSGRHYPVDLPPVQIGLGSEVFARQCGACHSVEPGQLGGLGPSLAGIGALAQDRVAGLDAEGYLEQSILHPEAYRLPGVQGAMPAALGAGLSDRELRAVIGYLVSQGGTINARRLANLQLERPPVLDDAGPSVPWTELVYGKQLFSERLGCAGCHGILGLPGEDRIAPSLAHAGLRDAAYLLQSILEPSAVIASGYRSAQLTLLDGSSVSGRVLGEDADAITLLPDVQVSPTALRVRRAEIDRIELADKSTMPPYALSERDANALVAFLRFLDGET